MLQPLSARPVVIASAADAGYVAPLAVMAESAAIHLRPGRTIELHVIDGGIPAGDKRELQDLFDGLRLSAHWHRPDRSAFLGVPLWGLVGLSVYDKLHVPDALPAEADQVLWLDADTLVLADLSTLWDRGTGAHAVLAARDPLVPFVSSRFGVAAYRELGLQRDAPHFNAGVMLIDLQRWRRQRVPARALEYVKRHANAVSFFDQEGLNAVLADQWGELDPSWNWSPLPPATSARAPHRANLPSAVKVVHFTGNLKPWRYEGRHPCYAVYYEHLDRTAWRGRRPAPRWSADLVRAYERSGLRRLLYPAEQLGARVWMSATRRLASPKDVSMTT